MSHREGTACTPRVKAGAAGSAACLGSEDQGGRAAEGSRGALGSLPSVGCDRAPQRPRPRPRFLLPQAREEESFMSGEDRIGNGKGPQGPRAWSGAKGWRGRSPARSLQPECEPGHSTSLGLGVFSD